MTYGEDPGTKASIFISRLCAWAPGICTSVEWNEWALGKREILPGSNGPELSFADPMFRRRLSQISKMTIRVIHDVMPFADDAKIIFTSFRGELSRQFKVNKMLIEEKTLSPAAFSLSVFNAPAALASITLGLKGGYSAIFPQENSFSCALDAAKASLLGAEAQEIIFVYADEEIQPQYKCFFNEIPPAISFGLLLSKISGFGSVPLPVAEEQSPFDFLKKLVLTGRLHVSP